MTAITATRWETTRRAAWLAALLLAVAGAWTAPAAAQEPDDGRTRVVGRVTDSVGDPLEGAEVRLLREGAGERQAPLTAHSQPSGGFQFVDVPAGTYRLRMEKAGFRPRERRVEVREGQVRSVVVRLRGAREARAAWRR